MYLRCRVRHMRPCSGDAAALRKLIEFLRRKGVIATEQRSACRLTRRNRRRGTGCRLASRAAFALGTALSKSASGTMGWRAKFPVPMQPA